MWEKLHFDWFVVVETGRPIARLDSPVVRFKQQPSPNINIVDFDCYFSIDYASGRRDIVRLDEDSFYATFYVIEECYSAVGRECCILLDVALSKGGAEAVVESFYNVMRHQQQSGALKDENLVLRAKLSWCLPSSLQCDSIIDEAMKIYREGDERLGISAHRAPVFKNPAVANSYIVSKVVDRVAANTGRCPFLI